MFFPDSKENRLVAIDLEYLSLGLLYVGGIKTIGLDIFLYFSLIP